MTLLLCAPLSETVYYISFGNKMSCLHIGIAILRYLLLHILDIHQLIFDFVHLCMHAKGPMWTF